MYILIIYSLEWLIIVAYMIIYHSQKFSYLFSLHVFLCETENISLEGFYSFETFLKNPHVQYTKIGTPSTHHREAYVIYIQAAQFKWDMSIIVHWNSEFKVSYLRPWRAVTLSLEDPAYGYSPLISMGHFPSVGIARELNKVPMQITADHWGFCQSHFL